jgi:hypothetical protein
MQHHKQTQHTSIQNIHIHIHIHTYPILTVIAHPQWPVSHGTSSSVSFCVLMFLYGFTNIPVFFERIFDISFSLFCFSIFRFVFIFLHIPAFLCLSICLLVFLLFSVCRLAFAFLLSLFIYPLGSMVTRSRGSPSVVLPYKAPAIYEPFLFHSLLYGITSGLIEAPVSGLLLVLVLSCRLILLWVFILLRFFFAGGDRSCGLHCFLSFYFLPYYLTTFKYLFFPCRILYHFLSFIV